jgi:hypothetical protein
MATDLDPDTSCDRSSPLRDWFTEPEQYRLKFQTYTHSPPEFTVQRISFQRQVNAYLNAYHSGASSAFPVRRRREPSASRDAESVERSQRRAKINCRKSVTELAPNHFVTFTTRESGPEYFTPADWRDIWSRFVRLMHVAGQEFDYVAVLERHPSNPQHLHLHVAWRGRAHYATMRRFWHMAILAHRGERFTGHMKGSASPGNIEDKPIKAPMGTNKRVFKIARYIAKYITKDLITEFNKKRYWVSKGLNVHEAKAFWLSADTLDDAVREAARLVGFFHSEDGLLFTSSVRFADRIFWARLDPDPPPF